MRLLGIVCAALALAGCWKSGVEPVSENDRGPEFLAIDDGRPGIVILYATCTLNASYLDVYGEDLGITPNIAAFASEGAVLTRHRTEAGNSGMAFAALFTGQHADGHGIFRHPNVMSEAVYDVSEALADTGYEVHYFGNQPMAAREFNYIQAAAPEHSSKLPLHGEMDRVRALLDRAAEDPSERIAVVTAFTVTHSPYDEQALYSGGVAFDECVKAIPKERLDRLIAIYQENTFGLSRRYDETVAELKLSDQDEVDLACAVESLYRANVVKLDRLFGQLMRELVERGLMEDAVIVFTADHGETLRDEHSDTQWSHGQNLRTDVMTVPMIVRAPGVVPQRHDFVSRSIDVAPTIAGLVRAALPAETGWEGVDLSGVLRGQADAPDLPAFSHTAFAKDGSVRGFALLKGDLVAWEDHGEVSVFRYPDETEDVYDPANPDHAGMVAMLAEYRARLSAAHRGDDTLSAEESEEILRSMGYIE